jgi:hypothetical protein
VGNTAGRSRKRLSNISTASEDSGVARQDAAVSPDPPTPTSLTRINVTFDHFIVNQSTRNQKHHHHHNHHRHHHHDKQGSRAATVSYFNFSTIIIITIIISSSNSSSSIIIISSLEA